MRKKKKRKSNANLNKRQPQNTKRSIEIWEEKEILGYEIIQAASLAHANAPFFSELGGFFYFIHHPESVVHIVTTLPFFRFVPVQSLMPNSTHHAVTTLKANVVSASLRIQMDSLIFINCDPDVNIKQLESR